MGFEIINKLKKEKGLTNAQLAELSGVTLSTLDKLTAGINRNPKLDTLQAICRALGCHLDDFDDDSPKDQQINELEVKLIKKYRTLDEYGKEAVDAVLNIEHNRCNEKAEIIESSAIAARGGELAPRAPIDKEAFKRDIANLRSEDEPDL